MRAENLASQTSASRQNPLARAIRELVEIVSEKRPASFADLTSSLRQTRMARAAEELFILATVAWIVLVCLRDGMPANAPHFAGAWIVYTWTTAIADFVLLPVVPVLIVGIPFMRFVSPEPNYWGVYRLASIVAVVWLLGASIGLWRMQ